MSIVDFQRFIDTLLQGGKIIRHSRLHDSLQPCIDRQVEVALVLLLVPSAGGASVGPLLEHPQQPAVRVVADDEIIGRVDGRQERRHALVRFERALDDLPVLILSRLEAKQFHLVPLLREIPERIALVDTPKSHRVDVAEHEEEIGPERIVPALILFPQPGVPIREPLMGRPLEQGIGALPGAIQFVPVARRQEQAVPVVDIAGLQFPQQPADAGIVLLQLDPLLVADIGRLDQELVPLEDLVMEQDGDDGDGHAQETPYAGRRERPRITGVLFLQGIVDFLPRDGQEDAHAAQVQNQARHAMAQERNRDTGQRNDSQASQDDDEELDSGHQGDA